MNSDFLLCILLESFEVTLKYEDRDNDRILLVTQNDLDELLEHQASLPIHIYISVEVS